MKNILKRIFSNSFHNTYYNVINHSSLIGRDEFFSIIEYERLRSHRFNNPFSLILIRFEDLAFYSHSLTDLINKISKRIRKIDHLGWYRKDCIGLLLPDTNLEGGKVIVEELTKECFNYNTQNLFEFSVISYPKNIHQSF